MSEKHFILAEAVQEGEPLRRLIPRLRKKDKGQFLVKKSCVPSLTCLVPDWYPRTLDRLEMRPL